MIQIIQLSFAYHDDFYIFQNLHLRLSQQSCGLVGPNASGKSTLLALIAGELIPRSGLIRSEHSLRFVPQLEMASGEGQADFQLLQQGRRSENWESMEGLWSLYADMEQELQIWGVDHLDLSDHTNWSGGTWQRLRLALAFSHRDSFLLLDEPSNHLDRSARLLLFQALQNHRSGCLIASHDRELLNLMDQIVELQPQGPRIFGGGYDFYKAARDQEQAAFQAAWDQKRQEFDKARAEAQKTRERQEKKSADGYRNRDKLGLSRLSLGLRRMQAERTASKLQAAHEEKIAGLQSELTEKAERLIQSTGLHFDAKAVRRSGDKPLLSLDALQHCWADEPLWAEPLYLQLPAGEHLAVCGDNGSGKSTLLRLIMGELEPSEGRIHRRFRQAFRLDQDLGTLPLHQSLLEIWQDPSYQTDAGLRRTIAARLGLKAREASIPLHELSGGQRLRAALILLATRAVPPDLILLDEPSNHLDLDALDCLVTTLRALPSSIIVVSHDQAFLQDLSIDHRLELVRQSRI